MDAPAVTIHGVTDAGSTVAIRFEATGEMHVKDVAVHPGEGDGSLFDRLLTAQATTVLGQCSSSALLPSSGVATKVLFTGVEVLSGSGIMTVYNAGSATGTPVMTRVVSLGNAYGPLHPIYMSNALFVSVASGTLLNVLGISN